MAQLDAAMAGCVSVYVEARGVLDADRSRILSSSAAEIEQILPHVGGEAAAYMRRLLRTAELARTPIEAQDVRTKADRLRWYLSRLKVEPVSEEISMAAIELLRAQGLHGHKYAIDAVVAATALHAVRPVIILTSGEDDMIKLCGESVRVVSV
ncbi:hypothetical protein [Actinomadura sp. 21ATH]|uniref:hypothetical protein n=1 Tax=Actinomadura sp. 21ATH TaxID=1735444 RepID=UPI0035BFDA74